MKRLVLLVLVAGCSSSTPTSTAPATGSLSVTVTSPDAAVTGLTVAGPNGYTKSITATTQLKGLAPGSYTITAPTFTTTDPIVATAYQATVTGSPATVSAGGTATATVSYATRPGSGALWIVGGIDVGANVQNTAIEYTVSQLHASSSVAPALALTFPMTTGRNIDANDVAFDPQGNMWVVNDNSNTVVEYIASQLGANGAPTAAVTIHLPDSSYTDGFAFDANGNLWVALQDPSIVEEFTADQIKASGTPTPAVTITVKAGPQGQLGYPLAIAFDAQGSLWVVNGTGFVVKYTASQITSSGTPVPAVTLRPQVMSAYYAAFDKAGNLWLADAAYAIVNGNQTTYVPGLVTEYATASLTASGSISSIRTLTLPVGKSVAFPPAIAFDASGNLWYLDVFNATLGEYTAAQLAAGGNPSPAITIVNTTPVYGTGLAFNPSLVLLPSH
jgi:hypothetical protein